jgi:steroid delta-isomerase-like uncharacterized protein
MSADENKAIVRHFLEEFFNQGNWALADELFSPTFINHDPAAPQARDREGLVRYFQGNHAGFPDGHTTADDIIAEGDKVVKRWTFRGTHSGEWSGMPPSGKQVTMTGFSMYRIDDGKIQEIWWNYDTLGLLQQLGVVPTPE